MTSDSGFPGPASGKALEGSKTFGLSYPKGAAAGSIEGWDTIMSYARDDFHPGTLASELTDHGVGDKIRTLRKKLGLTQAQVAGDDLTKSYVSQVELGHIQPSPKALKVMAERLGKPVQYFSSDHREELETIRLLLLGGDMLWSHGRLKDAVESFAKGLAVAEGTDREDVLAAIEMMIGQVQLTRGEISQAKEFLTRSLSRAIRIGNVPLGARAAASLAVTEANYGSFHEAVKWFQESLALAGQASVEDRPCRSQILEIYGDFWFRQHHWSSAWELYAQAVHFAEPRALARVAAIRIRMTTCLWRMNRREEAKATQSEIGFLMAALDDIDQRALLQLQWGRTLIEMRTFDAAYEHLNAAAAVFRQSRRWDLAASTYRAQLDLAHAADREDWLALAWCRVLRLPTREAPRWDEVRWYAWRMLIRQAIARGKLDRARVLAEAALKWGIKGGVASPNEEVLLLRVLEGHWEEVHNLWRLMAVEREKAEPPMRLSVPVTGSAELINFSPARTATGDVTQNALNAEMLVHGEG